MSIVAILGRPRQEDYSEFKVSLSYTDTVKKGGGAQADRETDNLTNILRTAHRI